MCIGTEIADAVGPGRERRVPGRRRRGRAPARRGPGRAAGGRGGDAGRRVAQLVGGDEQDVHELQATGLGVRSPDRRYRAASAPARRAVSTAAGCRRPGEQEAEVAVALGERDHRAAPGGTVISSPTTPGDRERVVAPVDASQRRPRGGSGASSRPPRPAPARGRRGPCRARGAGPPPRARCRRRTAACARTARRSSGPPPR